MDEKERFIASLYPAAIKVSRETGMSWQTILAQATQETGWGQHRLPGTHNIFNIKADSSWHGARETFKVWEIENGKKVWKDQSFRVYGSYEETLRDRVEFLRDNPRYAKAGLFDEDTKGNLANEAAALQRAGYATDPNYAQSLVRVFNSSTMQRAIKAAQAAALTPAHRDPDTSARAERHVQHPSLIKQGSHGNPVQALQTNLAELGYGDEHGHRLIADGVFGDVTRQAVERFQRDHHLTVDGISGPKTHRALADAVHARSHRAAPRMRGLLEAEPRLSSFDDPAHPQHAVHAALKPRMPPGTSRERLAQCTAACHAAGLDRPEHLGQVYVTDTKALFLNNSLFGHMAEVDLTRPPPPIEQSLQQAEQHSRRQEVQPARFPRPVREATHLP